MHVLNDQSAMRPGVAGTNSGGARYAGMLSPLALNKMFYGGSVQYRERAVATANRSLWQVVSEYEAIDVRNMMCAERCYLLLDGMPDDAKGAAQIAHTITNVV